MMLIASIIQKKIASRDHPSSPAYCSTDRHNSKENSKAIAPTAATFSGLASLCIIQKKIARWLDNRERLWQPLDNRSHNSKENSKTLCAMATTADNSNNGIIQKKIASQSVRVAFIY